MDEQEKRVSEDGTFVSALSLATYAAGSVLLTGLGVIWMLLSLLIRFVFL